MNKKTKRRLGLVLGVLLLLLSIPFIYRESQKKVELYVNPAFKISNYDSFYIDDSSYSAATDNTIYSILIAGGLKNVSSGEVTSKTLSITLKFEKGFIFPPYIGHFNPSCFITKTDTVEVYGGKSKELLLFRLYTWRGIFNYGHGPYEIEDFLKKGFSQAGWQEKVSGILIKFKAAEPAEPAD